MKDEGKKRCTPTRAKVSVTQDKFLVFLTYSEGRIKLLRGVGAGGGRCIPVLGEYDSEALRIPII